MGLLSAVSIPVVAVANRVLGDKPSRPRIVVAIAHQNHLRVRVRLAAVPAPELEGRRSCPGGRKHCPEGRRVLIERLALAGGIYRPQVA